MYENQAKAQELRQSQSVGTRPACELPREPLMRDRATEILRCVGELETEQSITWSALLGPTGECAANNNKQEFCLEELLAIISNRIASCVGMQRTLNSRL